MRPEMHVNCNSIHACMRPKAQAMAVLTVEQKETRGNKKQLGFKPSNQATIMMMIASDNDNGSLTNLWLDMLVSASSGSKAWTRLDSWWGAVKIHNTWS